MKKQELKKRLSLKKETVTNLENKEMDEVKGGRNTNKCEPGHFTIEWWWRTTPCYTENPQCY